MKILYVDAFAGISGDMTVGALLALGLRFEDLRDQLQLLPLHGYTIDATRREVHGITATKFSVHVQSSGHAHRAYGDIRAMLAASALAALPKQYALAIFAKLAEAEAKIHAMPLEAVEFHEVGAVDSIVDIVGTAIGWATLQIERAYVSALPLGSGIVQSQHGPLPVPAPATVELLRGFTTRVEGHTELVTPTGAAIVATLAAPAPLPELQIAAVGYGAGERTLADRPNVLRLILGESSATERDAQVVIETNIDDLNPELYEYAMDRLFAAGARDVYLTPVHMKKNRPGVVLSVICPESERERLANLILSETSAIGVRYHPVQRVILPREIREVTTPYGPIRVKISTAPDGHANIAPEYDDCKRAAQAHAVPLKMIYQAAVSAALPSAHRQQ